MRSEPESLQCRGESLERRVSRWTLGTCKGHPLRVLAVAVLCQSTGLGEVRAGTVQHPA